MPYPQSPMLGAPQQPGLDQWMLDNQPQHPQQLAAQPRPQMQQPMGMGQTLFNGLGNALGGQQQQQGQQQGMSGGMIPSVLGGVGNMLGFNQPPQQQQPGGMPMSILPAAQTDPTQDLGAPSQQQQGRGGMGQQAMQALMKMFLGA